MQKLILLMVAGGLGTLARYGFAGMVQRWYGGAFPAWTMAVNIAGCMLAGFLWTLAGERLGLSGEAGAYEFIGFMGAFTTVSPFDL